MKPKPPLLFMRSIVPCIRRLPQAACQSLAIDEFSDGSVQSCRMRNYASRLDGTAARHGPCVPSSMLYSILNGAAAAAAGTVALDVATYLDMVVRGRPASEVPAKTAERIATTAGIPLDAGISRAQKPEDAKQQVQARTSGLGALMGYVVGMGV